MTNNSKTKAKIGTLNVPIPIPIELLHFLSKKGQYIVTNYIVDQYAHVWVEKYYLNFLVVRDRVTGNWFFLGSTQSICVPELRKEAALHTMRSESKPLWC